MLKPIKTRAEIAQEYGISGRTLRRWIKKANIILPSGNLPPKYQKIIYNAFGSPLEWEEMG